MKKITVELEGKLMFSFKGADAEGAFLEISEPTGRIAGHIGELKAQIGGATKKAIDGLDGASIDTDDSNSNDPVEIGEAGFAMLTMGGANMKIVMATFMEILKETALINGEGKFTSPLFDRMAYNDIEKTLKMYIGHFMIAS